jgi:hypothetical protein
MLRRTAKFELWRRRVLRKVRRVFLYRLCTTWRVPGLMREVADIFLDSESIPSW